MQKWLSTEVITHILVIKEKVTNWVTFEYSQREIFLSKDKAITIANMLADNNSTITIADPDEINVDVIYKTDCKLKRLKHVESWLNTILEASNLSDKDKNFIRLKIKDLESKRKKVTNSYINHIIEYVRNWYKTKQDIEDEEYYERSLEIRDEKLKKLKLKRKKNGK